MEKLAFALKKTTSNKKRRKLFTDIHQNMDCEPYLLDVFIGHALKSDIRKPEEFLEKLSLVQRHVESDIPAFLKRTAEGLLPNINTEVGEFYQNDERYGNSGLAQRIQEMNDNGKILFEYPLYDSATSFFYCPKYFPYQIRESEWTYYDYRDFAEMADAIILYHATTNVFDENIRKNGFQPPVDTRNELLWLKDCKKYLAEETDTEATEKFSKSYISTRKYSVYFSTARSSAIKQDILYTNGEVEEYMERAERIYGGKGRLYLCIVPTDRLLPDEDAGGAKDWVESIYKMNSVKIDGCLEKENVFPVKNNELPNHRFNSKTLHDVQKRFYETRTILRTYLSENPLDKIC